MRNNIFCTNVNLISNIYDYLEICYEILQKKDSNRSPKIINIILNSIDLT